MVGLKAGRRVRSMYLQRCFCVCFRIYRCSLYMSWTRQVARHFILNKHDAVAPKLRCCGEFPLYAGPGRLGDQRAFDLIKELYYKDS